MEESGKGLTLKKRQTWLRTVLVGLIGAVVALLYPSSPTGSRWAGSGLREVPLIKRGSRWLRSS